MFFKVTEWIWPRGIHLQQENWSRQSKVVFSPCVGPPTIYCRIRLTTMVVSAGVAWLSHSWSRARNCRVVDTAQFLNVFQIKHSPCPPYPHSISCIHTSYCPVKATNIIKGPLLPSPVRQKIQKLEPSYHQVWESLLLHWYQTLDWTFNKLRMYSWSVNLPRCSPCILSLIYTISVTVMLHSAWFDWVHVQIFYLDSTAFHCISLQWVNNEPMPSRVHSVYISHSKCFSQG